LRDIGFTATGFPIVRDSALIDVGLAFELAPGITPLMQASSPTPAGQRNRGTVRLVLLKVSKRPPASAML
jgi:hypothetical protein